MELARKRTKDNVQRVREQHDKQLWAKDDVANNLTPLVNRHAGPRRVYVIISSSAALPKKLLQ